MRRSIYSVHPGVAMVQHAIAKLPAKTGRPLDDWIALIKKRGVSDVRGTRDWLKREYKLGTNYAAWVAERAAGKGEHADPDKYLEAAERYVDEMFSGAKAALRPIYDALLKLALAIGKDVKACPCKTIVPLYRHRVFAQIRAATRTRIDLGLSLGDMKTPKRVIDTGGFKKRDRITHRIEITSVADIDGDMTRWLLTAYRLDEKATDP
jgi:hypothetical protein